MQAPPSPRHPANPKISGTLTASVANSSSVPRPHEALEGDVVAENDDYDKIEQTQLDLRCVHAAPPPSVRVIPSPDSVRRRSQSAKRGGARKPERRGQQRT